MATNFRSLFRPQPPSPVPAFIARISTHALRVGVMVAIIMVELFFLLQSYLNSPLFPGDWSTYTTSFWFYVTLNSISLGLLALLPAVIPKDEYGKFRIQPNGVAGFCWTYVLFGALMWIVMIGYLWVIGNGVNHVSPILDDTLRLQAFVFYGIFVGPAEELFFRVVLPPYIGWVNSSVLAFSLFHMLAYTVGAAPITGVGLVLQIALAGIWGGIFWLIFSRFGIGAAIAAHTVYDLAVAGIILSGVAVGTLSVLLVVI